jgi:two-component system phosphate regulon sensor histidine kinase PhoR
MLQAIKKLRNILIIDVFIYIICLIGFYHLHEKSFLPAVLDYKNGSVVIKEIKNPDLQNVLKKNDIIVSINEYPISTGDDAEFICSTRRIGSSINLEIERSGVTFNCSIILEPFYSFSYLLTAFLVGNFFFFLGIFVLIKRPDDQVAQVFHWGLISVAILAFTSWAAFALPPLAMTTLIRILFSAGYAFIPPIFVHLSYIFPKIKWQAFKKLIIPLYSFSFLLSLAAGITFIIATNPISMPMFHTYMFVFHVIRFYFSVCLIFGVFNFIHSYRTALEKSERHKLQWVILGLSIGPISYVILWLVPQLFIPYSLVPEESILLLAAIAPLTIAISIVKYHIMDIELIFNRSTVYLLVITIIMILYTVIVALTAMIIGTLTLRASLLISAVSAIIVALLFEPARRSIQLFVDTKFFHVRYNYRLAQMNLSNSMEKSFDLKILSNSIIEELDKLLQLESIAFLAINESSQKWQILVNKNFKSLKESTVQSLIMLIKNTDKTVIAAPECMEAGIDFEKIDCPLHHDNGIVLVIPLKSREIDLTGFLILGRKKSGTRFSFEDIDLLKTISHQAGLAIDRIKLQQELVIKNSETEHLKELNQLKSFFVSSVSHELQTPLTSIKMFSELLQAKKNITSKERDEYLKIIEAEIGRLSRLIKNFLDFSIMERGIKEYNFSEVKLTKIIKNVLFSMKYQLQQHQFRIDLHLSRKIPDIIADADALVQALTNLISNAIKYSGDTKYLAITTSLENKYAVIHVSDKGIGISPKEQKEIFKTFYRSKNIKTQVGTGLGLSIVNHIIKAHRGKIKLKSRLGKGSTFSLFLPVEPKDIKNINYDK